jgi:sialic acid synthase SpsE
MNTHERQHTTVISEIGINHDSEMDKAIQLIRASAEAGVDFVKFQLRTPKLAVPEAEWNDLRDTPWGERMTKLAYRERMEFSLDELATLQREARMCGVAMGVSVFDVPSLERENALACPWIKIPSARVTDLELVAAAADQAARRGAQALVLSTGGIAEEQTRTAIVVAHARLTAATPLHLECPELWVLHCHMAYPAPTTELNLMCIPRLAWWMYDTFGEDGWKIGYSGHEYGRSPTEWAVALGAEVVERHITLDRSSKGSDHASSLEPWAFKRLVEHIRAMDGGALGDGVKRVWDSELPAIARLRTA